MCIVHNCVLYIIIYGNSGQIEHDGGWAVFTGNTTQFWNNIVNISHMILQDDNQSSSCDIFVPCTPAYKETNDLVVLDNPEEQERKFQEKQLFACHPLESYFDTICDNSSYKVCNLKKGRIVIP